MSIAKKTDLITEAEYLEGEQFSDVRHEYMNGKVYAMVGATRNHNLISVNVLREIGVHLKGKPCQPFMSDMKVKVDNQFFYPDILVDCSEDADGKSLFTENPVIIIEVLSDSTNRMDKTIKFSAYKNIPSLEEYVLIEQNYLNIEVFRRSDRWHGQVYLAGENITFESLGLTMSVEAIYDGVKIEDLKNEHHTRL